MKETVSIFENALKCKNCAQPLNSLDKFCRNCAAKVINQRITVKNLLSDFTNNLFGWDNKFFFTIRSLILRPQTIFKEYIDGTRKKYMNPFTFLGLGAALSLFVFNFFAEDYMALNVDSNRQTVEMMADIFEKQQGNKFDAETYKKDTMVLMTKVSSFMLKYFNLLVVLFMPFYTFLAFLTYRRPYNFGEHLVINSYIQGLSFLVTSVIFIITVFTNPSVYILTIVLLVVYYTYAYGKLHDLSVAESILKFLKFSGILILSFIIFLVLSFLLGIALATLKG